LSLPMHLPFHAVHLSYRSVSKNTLSSPVLTSFYLIRSLYTKTNVCSIEKETFSLKKTKLIHPPPSLHLEEGVFSVKMIKKLPPIIGWKFYLLVIAFSDEKDDVLLNAWRTRKIAVSSVHYILVMFRIEI